MFWIERCVSKGKFLHNRHRITSCKCISICSHLFRSIKVEIPPPPKKPLTSYMIFCKDNRQTILDEDPSLNMPEQVKKLAAKWSALSPELKKPYEVSARESTILYGEAHKKYYENLTEEQREELMRLKTEKKESRRLFRLKKALQESGIPRKANSAYTIFIQSQAKDKGDYKHPTGFIKEAALIWRTMPEEKKLPYIEQSNAEKEKYESEMKLWKQKLISEGKSKLLNAFNEKKKENKIASSIDDSSTEKKKK